MSSQNRYIFTQATAKDSAEMADVFAQQSFDGNLGIQYLRSEDPLSSFEQEGDEVVCLIVRDTRANHLLMGIGCCVIRRGIVGGKACNIGYLTGLKLRSEYHKQFPYIAKCYQWIRDNTLGKVDYYYTTILADNIYVQKMLEKKRKNMPLYCYEGDYNTYIFKTGGKACKHSEVVVTQCSRENAIAFYRQLPFKADFSVETLDQNHLNTATFYGLYKENQLIAISSILDQRTTKQYKVKHYGGVYKIVRHFPTKLLGYPAFPKQDEIISMSSMNIYTRNIVSDKELLYFIRQTAHLYTTTEMLVLGLHEASRLTPIFQSIKSICYQCRLYQVSFESSVTPPLDSNINIDISFQ